jgi:hypothetical protein
VHIDVLHHNKENYLAYGLSLSISFNDNRYSSIPIKHKVEASNQYCLAAMSELPYNKFKILLEQKHSLVNSGIS